MSDILLISEKCKNPMSSIDDNSITLTTDNPMTTPTTVRQALAQGLGYEIPANVETLKITANFRAVGEVIHDELSFFADDNIAFAKVTVVSTDGSKTKTFDQPVN